MRAGFVLGMAGMLWGALALGGLDSLGLRAVIRHSRGRAAQDLPLAIRGPYRWVRHPLYLFALVMIWTAPDLSADRLLFNVLFSLWIVVGTMLEERDLVAAFGQPYREYQRRVPMLFPSRRPGP